MNGKPSFGSFARMPARLKDHDKTHHSPFKWKKTALKWQPLPDYQANPLDDLLPENLKLG